MVLKTERPLVEGYEPGDVKKRTRKCRHCTRNFVTYEIHESAMRARPLADSLERRPLLTEAATKPPHKPLITG
jgi:hypothetical protein